MARLALAAAFMASAAYFSFPASAQEQTARPELSAEPAEAGTPEGAEELRGALRNYLTDTPFEEGYISVEPDADGLRIRISAAEPLEELSEGTVRFEPISLLVSEREDGNWNVFSDDPLDFEASFTIEDAPSLESYRQEWQLFKGVYSPELGAFLSAEGHAGPTRQTSRDEFSSSLVDVAGSFTETSAEPAEGGGANIAFRQTYEGLKQTSSFEIPLGEPGEDPAPEEQSGEEAGEPFGFSFDAAFDEVETSGTVGRMQARSMLDLYAVALSHADALIADPQAAFAGEAGAEILAAVRTTLPLWDEMDVVAAARGSSISTPYGEITIADMTQTARLSGVEGSSFFETEFSFDGIEAESPLIPEWAAPLVPSSMEMSVAVSDVDLATPAEIALAEVDFSQDPPLSGEARERIVEAFGADRIDMRLAPSRIEAELFEVSFDGEVSLADAAPRARLAVEMRGLDETIAALQAASVETPRLHEAVGVLQMAKGFGKAGEDGRTNWLVEVAGDGSVVVNGAMVKGPDGPSDDADETPPDDL